MPFAEPDPHAVRELALERLSAGPVETDGADRRFHRNAASFVERRKSCHAARLPWPCGTGPCPAVASPCRISKWHTRRLSVGMHSPRRPRRTSYEVKKRLPTTPALLQASNWHPLRMPIGRTMRARRNRQRHPSRTRTLLTSQEVCLDRRREVFANWHTRRVPIASAVTVGGGLACRALSAASQPGWANWHPRRVPLGDARPVMPPTRSQTPPIPKTFSDCSPPIVGITPREPGRSSSV
jgi:hypothetical protein